MPSLLLGAGRDSRKKVAFSGEEAWTPPLIRVDIDPSCKPDVLLDLNDRRLPFADGLFDEIGAYDVLEHLGSQGDWRGWFTECEEYWRVLKPEGRFGVLVPIGRDALADPGHTRFFSESYFHFLDQEWYDRAHSMQACITDYRWFWRRDFKILSIQTVNNHHIAAIMAKS